jgi:hypothetical protein
MLPFQLSQMVDAVSARLGINFPVVICAQENQVVISVPDHRVEQQVTGTTWRASNDVGLLPDQRAGLLPRVHADELMSADGAAVAGLTPQPLPGLIGDAHTGMMA